ncbi:hypothetical protein MNBD_GAMMA09-3032 [hydrothermal vent metagenome]|uniref:Uncharacterized protein n=1 Tax=hydrothermal vent metagenome TaxID=652676 RepID=A0A3B0YFM6_9ZZZZ
MTEADTEDDWVSKTQRKKDCDDILHLGEQLITLSKEDLSQMQMDDSLRHAVKEAQRIKSHGALKRQKHYIAKIMRSMDIETLSSQLQRILHKHDIHSAVFKRMEKWREAMLDDGDKSINDFIELYPHADRHHLRQLVRNTKKEKKDNKPPATYRQIFKYIREVVDLAEDPAAKDSPIEASPGDENTE